VSALAVELAGSTVVVGDANAPLVSRWTTYSLSLVALSVQLRSIRELDAGVAASPLGAATAGGGGGGEPSAAA
jgi:hypothetical protein